MNELRVSAWPIDKVIPFARNARKIPAAAVAKVAASIQEFGWRQPIVVDRDGVIICGHTRLLAARTRALRARDRRLARVLAGWLGQVPGVLHRDGCEETDSYKEKGENMIDSASFGVACYACRPNETQYS